MQISDLQQVFSGLLKKTEQTQSVELTPGQVINVAVRSVKGNQAMLSYRGMDLVAQLEVDIPEGEQLKFLVAGQKDGQIILKLLTNLGTAANDATGKILNVLSRLGLSGDTSNQELVKEMIKQQQPLDPDAVEKLASFLKNANVTEKNIWLPVFMFNKGISLTEGNYQKTMGLLTDMDYLHADLKQLSAEITRLAAANPQNELGQLAFKLAEVLSALNLESTQGPEVLTAKLESMFRMLTGTAPHEPGQSLGPAQTGGAVASAGVGMQTPTGVETPAGTSTQMGSATPGANVQTGAEAQGQMAGQIAGQAGATHTEGSIQLRGQNEPVIASSTQAKSADTYEELAGLRPGGAGLAELTDLAGGSSSTLKGNPLVTVGEEPQKQATANVTANGAAIGTDTDANSTEIGGRERGFSGFLASLEMEGEGADKGIVKPDLLDLLHRLSAKLAVESGDGHRELAKIAGRVAERLEFLQHFNQQAEPGRENLMIVHSSVNYEQNSEPLRMVIRYRQNPKGNKREFSSCSIEVKLSTPGLGAVKCDIRVKNQDLEVQFVTETEAAGRLLDSLGGNLISRLERVNYHVMMKPYKLQPQDTKDFLPERNHEIPGLFQINLMI